MGHLTVAGCGACCPASSAEHLSTSSQTPQLACGSYQGETCTTRARPYEMMALPARPSAPSTCMMNGAGRMLTCGLHGSAPRDVQRVASNLSGATQQRFCPEGSACPWGALSH